MSIPKKISKEILKIFNLRFKYNSRSGDITYKKRVSKNTNIGILAGHINKKRGYRAINVNGRLFPSHRIAWYLYYGKMPKEYIDHKNGNKLDNRIVNLREVTKGENNQNTRIPRKDNTSGYLGVSFCNTNKKFISQIRFNGKKIRIGYFDFAIDAYNAYLITKRRLHKTCTI